MSWDLIPYNNVLLAATKTSVYELNEKTEQKIFDSPDGAFKIFINPTNKENLFIAGEYSLQLVKYKDHKMTTVKEYDYAKGIRSMVSDSKGIVFFGGDEYVYMFNSKQPDTLTTFTKKDGIDTTSANFVFIYNNEILVGGMGGIYSFREKDKPSFIKQPKYNIIKENIFIQRAEQVKNDIWSSGYIISNNSPNENEDEDGICILKQTPSGFIKENKQFRQIEGLKAHCIIDDSNKVYIGTNDGLIAYDLNYKTKDYPFYTFISKIVQKADTNIVIENYFNGLNCPPPELLYKNHELNIYVSASDYTNKNELEFSYYLEGVETDYCKYTKDSKISYSNLINLYEGNYTLHVKSRNMLGIEGKPVSFPFTILPPWYRTKLAYASYFLCLVFLIIVIVRLNTKRLKEQNIKLEKIIAERTAEVVLQKNEAEKQKGLVEEKHKEVMDSIKYAKRIQTALITNEKYINNALNRLMKKD